MSNSALEYLVEESASRRIGSCWLEEIRTACVQVSRRFDPAVYAVSESTWTQGEIDQLVQEVTAEQLLRQGQLVYILDVALSIDDVHRLLRHQVRRALVARRRRTVVNRLLTRISALLDGTDSYERLPYASPPRFRPVHAGWDAAEPSVEGLRRAGGRVRLLPTSAAGGDGAPAVFCGRVLAWVVSECFDACETSLSIDDFGRILREALTSWVPVMLEPNEELGVEAPGAVDLIGELEETVHLMIEELDETQRVALVTKLGGASDSVLAEELSINRPTAARVKADAFIGLQNAWQHHASDVAPGRHAVLAQVLYLRLREQAGQ